MNNRLTGHPRAPMPLGFFWLALLPLYGLWLWCDQVVAPWDMSIHARCALRAWQSLAQGRPWRLYALSDYYPPFFHLLAAPFSLLATHPDVYCAANWLALLGLMLATAWLGQMVSQWGDDMAQRDERANAAGLAAGLLVPAFVSVTWMARQPMTDLTLTLTVAVTLGLLTRGRRLGEGRQAHALGLAVATGLLAKWPWLFFTALPLVIYLWREWRLACEPRAFWRPLGWVVLWPALLAGPWYIRALPRLAASLLPQLGGAVARREGDPGVLTLSSLTWYARQFYALYLRLPLTLLLAAGAAALAWRFARGKGRNPQVRRGWALLALSLASGYGILTVIANKDPRYIMPVVPVLAVTMTQWLPWLASQAARRVALGALALLGAGLVAWNLFVFYPPDLRPTGVEEAARWIIAHKPEGRRKIKVRVIPNDWRLNAAALDFALYRRDGRSGAKFISEPLTAAGLKDYQYLLLLDPPDPDTPLAPNIAVNTRAAKSLAGWTECASIPRGDGKTIRILQQTE